MKISQDVMTEAAAMIWGSTGDCVGANDARTALDAALHVIAPAIEAATVAGDSLSSLTTGAIRRRTDTRRSSARKWRCPTGTLPSSACSSSETPGPVSST